MYEDLRPVLHLFNKVELECEYPLHHTSAQRRSSCLSGSMVGPGLDSDFGASAGTHIANRVCVSERVVYMGG